MIDFQSPDPSNIIGKLRSRVDVHKCYLIPDCVRQVKAGLKNVHIDVRNLSALKENSDTIRSLKAQCFNLYSGETLPFGCSEKTSRRNRKLCHRNSRFWSLECQSWFRVAEK